MQFEDLIAFSYCNLPGAFIYAAELTDMGNAAIRGKYVGIISIPFGSLLIWLIIIMANAS